MSTNEALRRREAHAAEAHAVVPCEGGGSLLMDGLGTLGGGLATGGRAMGGPGGRATGLATTPEVAGRAAMIDGGGGGLAPGTGGGFTTVAGLAAGLTMAASTEVAGVVWGGCLGA
jgi:hypothetical protein